MNVLPKEIVKFIKEHHVATVATVSEEGLSCCNLFYSFLAEQTGLVFTSSLTTEHGANMLSHPEVAASIVVESKVVGKIRGLQIKGVAVRAEAELESQAKLNYLKKFPFAVVAPLELWVLKITSAKLTDNRLGFGKKLKWSVESVNNSF